MKSAPEKQRRKSIRLPDYDYSEEGAYFVTICCRGREEILIDERFRRIVEKYWVDLLRHYRHIATSNWMNL